MNGLRKLYCNDNSILKVSKKMKRMTNLMYFNVENNPICKLKPEEMYESDEEDDEDFENFLNQDSTVDEEIDILNLRSKDQFVCNLQ